MIEITNEAVPWTDSDEIHWDSFLKTDTGKRLVPKLAERMPALLDGGDNVNKILIRSGEARGFQIAVASLLELTHSPPLPIKQESSYPPLDDDAQWERATQELHTRW